MRRQRPRERSPIRRRDDARRQQDAVDPISRMIVIELHDVQATERADARHSQTQMSAVTVRMGRVDPALVIQVNS